MRQTPGCNSKEAPGGHRSIDSDRNCISTMVRDLVPAENYRVYNGPRRRRLLGSRDGWRWDHRRRRRWPSLWGGAWSAGGERRAGERAQLYGWQPLPLSKETWRHDGQDGGACQGVITIEQRLNNKHTVGYLPLYRKYQDTLTQQATEFIR